MFVILFALITILILYSSNSASEVFHYSSLRGRGRRPANLKKWGITDGYVPILGNKVEWNFRQRPAPIWQAVLPVTSIRAPTTSSCSSSPLCYLQLIPPKGEGGPWESRPWPPVLSPLFAVWPVPCPCLGLSSLQGPTLSANILPSPESESLWEGVLFSLISFSAAECAQDWGTGQGT